MKKIYLASPYSHRNPNIREQRFKEVCKIAAELINEGNAVFCPIAHSHPIAIYGSLPIGSDYWEKLNRLWIDWCDEMVIANLPYWPQSRGIEKEKRYAKSIGKKIFLTQPYYNLGRQK